MSRVTIGLKAILLISSSMTILAGTIIAPSLPQIEKAFHQDVDITFMTSLVLTITSLFIAIAAPFMGWIADIFGRRKVLLSSLFLYGFAGGSGLYIQNIYMLLFSRTILGCAVAGIMTSITSMIADFFQGKEREKFLGFQASCMALGGFFFFLTGGYLASIYWRLPFTIYFLSWLLLPFVFWVLEEPKNRLQPLPLSSPVPFSKMTYACILLTAMSGMIFYFFIPTKMPFYIYHHFGLEPKETGLFLGVSTLFIALSSSLHQQLRRFLTKEAIYALMFIFIGLGLSLLGHVEAAWSILTGMCITALGFGQLIPNSTVWVTEMAPLPVRARLVGGLSSCLFIGQFLSSLVGEPLYLENGLSGTFGLYSISGAIALIIGSLIAIIIFTKKKRFQ